MELLLTFDVLFLPKAKKKSMRNLCYDQHMEIRQMESSAIHNNKSTNWKRKMAQFPITSESIDFAFESITMK